MIDPVFEKRVINWARANRCCRKHPKCATLTFCEALRYLYGTPEPEEGEETPVVRQLKTIPVDVTDAGRLDQAYRLPHLSPFAKKMIRLRYIHRLSPFLIEKRMHLRHRTFSKNIEEVMHAFKTVVDNFEEVLTKKKECEKLSDVQ